MKPDDLVKWRTKAGYTQEELAKILGVAGNTVWRWENGQREIPSFLHITLKCIEKKGGESKIVEGKSKELSDADIRKILMKELQSHGMTKAECQCIKEAYIQELIHDRREMLKETFLRACDSFAKRKETEKGKKVKK